MSIILLTKYIADDVTIQLRNVLARTRTHVYVFDKVQPINQIKDTQVHRQKKKILKNLR